MIHIMSEYFYGQTEDAMRAGTLTRPAERRGVPDTGRIVKLLVGRGHGFIRLADDREVYFHRADLHDGTSISDFGVGDAVTFERLDDPVSGARALGVRRQQSTR